MHSLWAWLTKDSNHDLLVALIAAIVGGLIGFVGSIVGVVGAYWLTVWSDAETYRQRYRALLSLLLAEIIHTQKTIKEIATVVIDAKRKSTKRMNSDIFIFSFYRPNTRTTTFWHNPLLLENHPITRPITPSNHHKRVKMAE